MSKVIVRLIFLLFVMVAPAFGAETIERFPRPDFDSGYELPIPSTPAARAQWLEWLDVGVLVATLALATWFAIYRRSRRGMLLLVIFCLLYFGFFRLGCVCSIGAVQNVTLSFTDSSYAIPLGVILFFSIPLVFALFAGRVFCSSVCPLGAIQDLVVFKPVSLPQWVNGALGMLRYLYLGLAVLFAATGAGFIICRYDPFIGFFRMNGHLPILLIGGVLLVAGLFLARPYCRFLCPYGLILGWLSVLSYKRVTVTPDDCIQCRLCEDACPFDAIRKPSVPRAPERREAGVRRLTWLIALLPVLIVGGGWAVSRLDVVLARAHPVYRVAEQIHLEESGEVKEQTLESETFRASGESTESLMRRASRTLAAFHKGSWILGGFFGLAVGLRLITWSVRRQRTDYEPDRTACVACGRCFRFCPREHQRQKNMGLPQNLWVGMIVGTGEKGYRARARGGISTENG